MHRLLLVGCSASKSCDVQAIPAIDRYLGTTFKVIKKAKREGYWPKNIDLYIVSARFGLVSEYALIEPYDQRMTQARAQELQVTLGRDLDVLLKENHYYQILINLGKMYMQCVSLSNEIKHAHSMGILQEAFGSIGIRQQQTKLWLLEQKNLDDKNEGILTIRL